MSSWMTVSVNDSGWRGCLARYPIDVAGSSKKNALAPIYKPHYVFRKGGVRHGVQADRFVFGDKDLKCLIRSRYTGVSRDLHDMLAVWVQINTSYIVARWKARRQTKAFQNPSFENVLFYQYKFVRAEGDAKRVQHNCPYKYIWISVFLHIQTEYSTVQYTSELTSTGPNGLFSSVGGTLFCSCSCASLLRPPVGPPSVILL